MSYADFTLPRVQAELGVTLRTDPDLFGHVRPVPVMAGVRETILGQLKLATAINTEKARSEWLIAPLLGELWRRCEGKISLFSGVPLDVDAEAGLVGRCDFLIGLPPQLHYVTAPLITIIEAKNEDIAGGLGQCAAAMVAAQRFNARNKMGIETIHGCVSDGGDWKFSRLTGTILTIDVTEYHISQMDHILGILLSIVAPVAGVSIAA